MAAAVGLRLVGVGTRVELGVASTRDVRPLPSWRCRLDTTSARLDACRVPDPANRGPAVAVRRSLAERGHHRAPSIPDLLIAATAELAGPTVLHLDKNSTSSPRSLGSLWSSSPMISISEDHRPLRAQPRSSPQERTSPDSPVRSPGPTGNGTAARTRSVGRRSRRSAAHARSGRARARPPSPTRASPGRRERRAPPVAVPPLGQRHVGGPDRSQLDRRPSGEARQAARRRR